MATAAQENAVEFHDVDLKTPDGTVLRAWSMRPRQWNGAAVILLHGVSDNRLGMYGYGKWLVQNHYSVILADARAHGSSGGELATYGLMESDDVHRWVDLDRDDRTSTLHVWPRRIDGSSAIIAITPKGASLLRGRRRVSICDVS